MVDFSADNAFGFSMLTEDEIKDVERKLLEEKETRINKVSTDMKDAQERIQTMYNMIKPLLINLSTNADKPYILWPNRSEKIAEFLDQLDKLVGVTS